MLHSPFFNVFVFFGLLFLCQQISFVLFVYDRSICSISYFRSLFVGCGGALVETMTFNRRAVGSTPALYPPRIRTLASPLPAVAGALRRETPTQYPCCCRERL